MYRFITLILITLTLTPATHAQFLVGRAMTDVTGPARGIQMWGFSKEGQLTEGIHTRLFSRAFVIADSGQPNDRAAVVIVDIGSITHAMQLEIVDQLQKTHGDLYTRHNTIISATHTHAGVGGFWHTGGGTPLGSSFNKIHFDHVVSGIVASINAAHADLQPATIKIDRGIVDGAGANRSMPAYNNNPEDERARYDAPTDKTMTLLKIEGANGPLGTLNWFASHPTAMTFDNKLISADHKGYASRHMEAELGDGFVAAFANTNCGDVTPNLNLNNTGPGVDDFDSTRIIGQRQLDVALQLFANASTEVNGGVTSAQTFVNLSGLPVDPAYTAGAGAQVTCPSAYGYSMAAGSTEDGGGHPLFKEGMTKRNGMIDGVVKTQFGMPEPSDDCRACHEEKPILFGTGESDPPMQPQIQPIGITRVGQLALASLPAEVTTMAGRRLRETIGSALDIPAQDVILVTYTNQYAGYITTREEYAMQQYEGGHTLHGPWTLAAYQQSFVQLAADMADGPLLEPEMPTDLRGVTADAPLLEGDPQASKDDPGLVAKQPGKKYKGDDQATATFHAQDPRINFPQSKPYVTIQQLNGETWSNLHTDDHWSTKLHYTPNAQLEDPMTLTITWDIPENTPEAQYRFTYTDGNIAGTTRPFRYRP